jgi:uncharacterized membrane-anchored protein YjiN (DUF445 family)
MSLMDASPADQQRRAGLRRMRALALSLLGFAAVVYVLTLRNTEGSWGYINTAAEAAMVGALADWFAVTALFRHPLGVPIPHTAIVPKRKSEIGRNLQDFVTENFLTEDIARERLATAEVGRRFGAWLGEPQHRHRALSELARVGRVGLHRLRDDEVRAFVLDVLLPRLVHEPLSPIAGSLLEEVIKDGAHHGLVDLAVEELHDWLVDNPEIFAAVLGERAPWWTPPWVDERVIRWTYHQAVAWLQDIRTDSAHPARIALDNLLAKLSVDLQHDQEVIDSAEALKTHLLTHPQVGVTVLSLWRSIRVSLLAAIDDETSHLWVRGDALLAEFGERLVVDAALRSRLEGHLGDAVSFFVNTYGHELAAVISHTIDRWDAREASERIELHVGRDLQFIRINGTIVGALAGLAIHTVSQVLY